MAVTPLGNTIFINQNVNMVSSKVADVQNRFDLQNRREIGRAHV